MKFHSATERRRPRVDCRYYIYSTCTLLSYDVVFHLALNYFQETACLDFISVLLILGYLCMKHTHTVLYIPIQGPNHNAQMRDSTQM